MPKRSPRLMIKSTKKYAKYLYYVFLVILALGGVFCSVFSKIFINRFIDKYMQLRPDAEILDMWRSPDVNVSIDFYFFNWTNPEEFYNASVKPRLQQVGPYSFLEFPEKEIFQWHPENNTLDYAKKHLYYFNEAVSKRPLTDKLVTLNALMVAAASKTKNWSYMKNAVVDVALRLYKNGIVWKRTAEEFFFKGFEDNIVNLLAIFPSSFRSSMGIFVPWDRIGFLYGRNGSTEFLGTHTINTGGGDMENFGQLLRWKGKNYTEAFSGKCSEIKGSPGEFQKTNLKKNESIQYFLTDFCRSAQLDYIDEVLFEGIVGYRYGISPNVFDNGTLNPDNKCFCGGACLPYGVLNISSCWFDLPLFISNPHFLDADPFFESKVEGMKPDIDLHATTAILEPRTGFILQLKGRLQLNFRLEPSSHIKSYQNKRDMLFPALWFDMTMRISDDSAKILKIVQNLELYCHIFGATVMLISLTLFLWRPLKALWNKRYTTHHMEINTMAEDDDDMNEGAVNDIKAKEALYGLPPNFPSLLYISHPRLSLPVVVSHLNEDEALSSCIEDNRRQEMEREFENLAESMDSS